MSDGLAPSLPCRGKRGRPLVSLRLLKCRQVGKRADCGRERMKTLCKRLSLAKREEISVDVRSIMLRNLSKQTITPLYLSTKSQAPVHYPPMKDSEPLGLGVMKQEEFDAKKKQVASL